MEVPLKKKKETKNKKNLSNQKKSEKNNQEIENYANSFEYEEFEGSKNQENNNSYSKYGINKNFNIKIPRLFVFQSLRNAEVAIELLRKTEKGGLLPQDSINYVIFYFFF